MVCPTSAFPHDERGGRRRKHYLIDTDGQARAGPRVSHAPDHGARESNQSWRRYNREVWTGRQITHKSVYA